MEFPFDDDQVVLNPRNVDSLPSIIAGRGLLEVENVAGRSVATRVLSHAPLRILTPRKSQGNAAWVFTSTFGGGLVSGDQIDIQARIGVGARCVLATQSSTKVFCSNPHGPVRQTNQSLHLSVASSGFCAVLPDPVTCFAGARFEQRLRVNLDRSASLLLVDCLTSGRRARGERWAFARYASRIEAAIDSKLIFRDAVLLEQEHGPLDSVHRMGRYDCLGLMLMLGPHVSAAADAIVRWAAGQSIHGRDDLIFSVSPVADGVVIRVAGTQTETVGRWIRHRLDFLSAMLGADPWSRKW